MGRAGGWILVLLVVGAMAGGGWFALRRTLQREPAVIVLLSGGNDREPTRRAIARGARFALEEAGHRAGKYRVTLQEWEPGASPETPGPIAAWVGPGEAILSRGQSQGRPFSVSVFDTHPTESDASYRISPGWERQGTSAARWARKTGASRVVLLHDAQSLRSRAIGAAFDRAARSLGLSVEGPLEATTENVGRVLPSKPDLVFYAGEEAPYSSAARIFGALRRNGYSGRMVTGEADPEVSYLATRSGPVDGTLLVSPFAPAPPDLAVRMGVVPGPHVTAGYFAMKAALDTIDRANSIDENGLHRAAAAIHSTRPCALYVARAGLFEFVELLD